VKPPTFETAPMQPSSSSKTSAMTPPWTEPGGPLYGASKTCSARISFAPSARSTTSKRIGAAIGLRGPMIGLYGKNSAGGRWSGGPPFSTTTATSRAACA
jgi:hypothetical protein